MIYYHLLPAQTLVSIYSDLILRKPLLFGALYTLTGNSFPQFHMAPYIGMRIFWPYRTYSWGHGHILNPPFLNRSSFILRLHYRSAVSYFCFDCRPAALFTSCRRSANNTFTCSLFVFFRTSVNQLRFPVFLNWRSHTSTVN